MMAVMVLQSGSIGRTRLQHVAVTTDVAVATDVASRRRLSSRQRPSLQYNTGKIAVPSNISSVTCFLLISGDEVVPLHTVDKKDKKKQNISL